MAGTGVQSVPVMVDLGQLAVTGAHPERGVPGLVALRLTDLAARVPPASLRRPQRGPYHLVMLVTVGHGRHSIDFMDYACRPGTLLWARPGQAHQFGTGRGLDATMLIFNPTFVPRLDGLADLLDDAFAPTCWLPAGEDEEAILTEIAQIATDCARYGTGEPVSTDLLRHQLGVLLLRIATLPSHARGPGRLGNGPVMSRFRQELERSFAQTRRVEDYAERLGYSVRTLTRACLAACGRSAKQVVDARVALEAKRMLACEDEPVAEVGRRLGFPEPTNFGRFFIRETGRTPGEFRAAYAASRARRPVLS
jgi:AraC-like DNA-binding protein